MNKGYRLGILLVVALVVLAFSVPAFAQDPVVVRWWHIGTTDPGLTFNQEKADIFMAEHPGVTIEITVLENEAFKTQLTTVMQAGDPPDLFHSWGGGVLWTYAENGLLRDISPELEGEWKDSIATQAALELYGMDGAYYGVPNDWGAVGMFYNKALFEQAGLDPENPPETWTEFLDAVQMLKDAGITPIALGEGDKWPGHYWWVYLAMRIGGEDAFLKAYSREGSFADEPFVQAGEYLNQLIALEPFPEGFLAMTYGDEGTLMGNGEAAMELMGQWSPDVQKSNSDDGLGIGDDLGWFQFPMVEGGAGNAGDAFGGGNGYSVGVNAPDAAVEFLRYLTSEEVQREAYALGIAIPTVVGVDDLYEGDPIKLAIVQARNNAPYSQLYYDQFLPPAVGAAVNDAVETLFAGLATPEEAAQAIEDAASFELD